MLAGDQVTRLRRIVDSRYLIWALLALPGIYMLQSYVRGSLFYGELMHASGDMAARLLILALAITPLRLIFPRSGWPLWLLQRRRYIGVAAFGFALLHAAVYAQRLGDIAAIGEDAREASMWTGWLALVVMLPLAATSNHWSVRKLGRRWKTLHRLVYAAALLTLGHWFLAAFDPLPGIMHFAVLACLQALRLWRVGTTRHARTA